MWNAFIPELSKKHRIITIDLLGHGETECLGYVHSMEDQADMVHAVLHELKIRKTVLIGHSLGGYVALAFAELYPDYVKGLFLLNSTSRADSDERKTNRDRAIKAVKQNYTNFVRLSIANLFSEDNREKLETEIEKVKKMILRINDFMIGMFRGIGIKLVDFKIEFGRYFENEYQSLLLADEISPDSCRLWDIKSGKKLDKDVFRRDLGSLTDAYTEVADRLGLLPKTSSQTKPTLVR